MSILTGLQAARELAAGTARRDRPVLDQDGGVVPRRRLARGRRTSSTASPAAPSRSSSSPGSRGPDSWPEPDASAAPARCPSTWSSTAVTAGPGRTAPCRPRSTSSASPTPGPGWPAPRWGWTSSPSPGWLRPPDLPVLPRALLHARGAGSRPVASGDVGFPGPLHRQTSLRWLVHRCRGRGRPRHRPRPGSTPTPTCAPVRSSSPTATTSSTSTWPSGPGRSVELSAIERPLRSTAAAEILGYADKYVGGEGHGQRAASAPGRPRGPGRRRAARRGARCRCALADVRGVARIDFLSDGGVSVRERGQHRPRVPGPVSVGGAARLPFIDLLDGLIGEALARPSVHYSAAGADGTVLRSAGGIASKLA